jgi:hypothetical protein
MKTIPTNKIIGSASRPRHACLVLVLCFISTGCSSLVGRDRGPLANLDRESIRAAEAGVASLNKSPVLTENGEPCIVLDVRDGKKHLEKIPLRPGESMFVGDMVRDAQLYKRIGKIKLSIFRPNGPERPPVRLDVDFDSTGQKVMEGQNYSLRAGDRVVVTRDDTTVFTGMLTPFKKG